MEQQIQDLINSIKKDGIDSATSEGKKIIEEAQSKAQAIISDAMKERDKMIADAEKKLEVEKESSIAAVKMASRDLCLSFKRDVEKIFQSILDKKVKEAMDASLLREVLATVIKAEFSSDVVVTLPQEKQNEITSSLAQELASELEHGVSFAFSSSLSGGFRVEDKDGMAYIDLSDDECTKLLYPYISSSIKDLI